MNPCLYGKKRATALVVTFTCIKMQTYLCALLSSTCINTSEYIAHHVAIMHALCNMQKSHIPATEYGMCMHLIHAPAFSLVFFTRVVNVQHYYCFFSLNILAGIEWSRRVSNMWYYSCNDIAVWTRTVWSQTDGVSTQADCAISCPSSQLIHVYLQHQYFRMTCSFFVLYSCACSMPLNFHCHEIQNHEKESC